MFVSLSNGNFIIDVDSISYVKWISTKNLALIRMKDGSDEWINNSLDFESLRTGLLSNDLKVGRVTTRQPRTRQTHARNYHKPAELPLNHIFQGGNSDQDCTQCKLPFSHPCHNASNPIEGVI